MAAPLSSISSISSAWEVLLLFLLPIGGGIPAGVLLARSRGIEWPGMIILYFISDVILACVFEPVLMIVIALGRRSPFVKRLREAFKKAKEKMEMKRKSMTKSTPPHGSKLGPLALILFAFGADPMSGRTAAASAGHGFLMGWLLAIVGDMLYFTVLMIGTLWLSKTLGDETRAMALILVAMILVPFLVRRFRLKRQCKRQ